MGCLECKDQGGCCYTNFFEIDNLTFEIQKNEKFASYLENKFPQISDEILFLQGMTEEELQRSLDSYFDQERAMRNITLKPELCDKIRIDTKLSCLDDFDPDSLFIEPDNPANIIYRIKLKLSYLGRDGDFNPEGYDGKRCVFLEGEIGKNALCIIHPLYLKDRGIEVLIDPRGNICSADYECQFTG
jgi:hypothetical protein